MFKMFNCGKWLNPQKLHQFSPLIRATLVDMSDDELNAAIATGRELLEMAEFERESRTFSRSMRSDFPRQA